ncbi:MAG: DUF2892 domain-containing protein [Patescibacteria group bacterium]|nr:DUF2892 domain-containing protein [Patescibacteria group bacterium]
MFKIKNEGTADRILRVALSLVFFEGAFYMLSGWWQIVFYVLGFVMLITALTGFCLVYKIFGWHTNKNAEIGVGAEQDKK